MAHRGIVTIGLVFDAAIIKANIRILRSWADQIGDRTHLLCAVEPEDHGFEELDAAGSPHPA